MLKLQISLNIDSGGEEKALINADSGEVLLIGDAYHDKIDDRIEGFLQGLDYCEKNYEVLYQKTLDEEEFDVVREKNYSQITEYNAKEEKEFAEQQERETLESC